jgi:hypothetical protein
VQKRKCCSERVGGEGDGKGIRREELKGQGKTIILSVEGEACRDETVKRGRIVEKGRRSRWRRRQ